MACITLADPKRVPLLSVQSLIFMQLSSKFLQNDRFVHLPRELVPPEKSPIYHCIMHCWRNEIAKYVDE